MTFGAKQQLFHITLIHINIHDILLKPYLALALVLIQKNLFTKKNYFISGINREDVYIPKNIRNVEIAQADVDYGVQVDADKGYMTKEYLAKCNLFLNDLKIRIIEIQRIQLKTIGQSSNSEWLEER